MNVVVGSFGSQKRDRIRQQWFTGRPRRYSEETAVRSCNSRDDVSNFRIITNRPVLVSIASMLSGKAACE